MDTTLLILFMLLLVTLPACTVSWSLWSEYPHQRQTVWANFHWLWFLGAIVLFVLGRA